MSILSVVFGELSFVGLVLFIRELLLLLSLVLAVVDCIVSLFNCVSMLKGEQSAAFAASVSVILGDGDVM